MDTTSVFPDALAWRMTSRAAELVRASDIELREEIDALAEHIESDDPSDDPSDRFYWLIGEIFERFAPSVELEFVQRRNVDGPKGLEQLISRMGVHHAARLTARATETSGTAENP